MISPTAAAFYFYKSFWNALRSQALETPPLEIPGVKWTWPGLASATFFGTVELDLALHPRLPGTFSGTFSGTLLNPTQRLHPCTPELFWAEDPISLRCWGKIVTSYRPLWYPLSASLASLPHHWPRRQGWKVPFIFVVLATPAPSSASCRIECVSVFACWIARADRSPNSIKFLPEGVVPRPSQPICANKPYERWAAMVHKEVSPQPRE